MHDLLIVGVPLLAILAGIFLNNQQLEKLEARMTARFTAMDSRFDKFESNVDSRFNRLESRMDRMQSDLSQFYTILGKHEVRLDVLEKRPTS